ncbi:MAG: Crp/Fnr family transcriptional regulator [Pyrinomonadaceae bacterium]
MKEMLTNKILTGLPDAEFARLLPLLEPVSLAGGEQLNEIDQPIRFVYFPENSVVSCRADMRDGKSAEVGMIGREGVAGLPSLLGTRPASQSLKVCVGGSALKMRRQEFELALERGNALRHTLMSYAGDYIAQVSQRSACAALHRTEQRFAVWLLMLHDRLGADAIEITHERIANHLGVRRAGITEIAGELQRLGVISYTRGSLRVTDRRRLEEIACECYAALNLAGRQPTLM